MIIFVGSEAKGFFVEEIAEKRKEKFAYVESKSRILQQSYEILSYEGVEHMVFDISQYADSPEELTNEIIKMSKCNNAKIIILAPGYSLKTKILTELYTAGVRNYILGTTLAEMKQQLELSLTDYYEVNGRIGSCYAAGTKRRRKDGGKLYSDRGGWRDEPYRYNNPGHTDCKIPYF